MELINQYSNVIIAALVVLALIIVILLVWRALSPSVKGGRRGQRLGISEYHELDQTRRLVLVRRDNVEHLILIGGPADVVIEAFACRLPESFEAAMARRVPAPCWINLDYLSAEAWVSGCHALPSPHPRLPLTKYFFFPGFDETTGGLLREHDLADARRVLDGEAQLDAGVGALVRLLDLRDQVDAKADDA